MTATIEVPAIGLPTLRPGVILPEWTPDMGDVWGHYRNKPHGSRFITATNYTTSRGLLRASEVLPLHLMTKRQIQLELEDLIWAGRGDVGARAIALLQLLEAAPDDIPGHIPPLLETWRESYPAPIAPWDPPREIRLHIYRKGWRPPSVHAHHAQEI